MKIIIKHCICIYLTNHVYKFGTDWSSFSRFGLVKPGPDWSIKNLTPPFLLAGKLLVCMQNFIAVGSVVWEEFVDREREREERRTLTNIYIDVY